MGQYIGDPIDCIFENSIQKEYSKMMDSGYLLLDTNNFFYTI